MPKKYYGLSDQTKDTFTDNVKPLAIAWDCCTSFIYQILRSEKSDVYPPFQELYASLCKAGISTREYDSDMEMIRAKYSKNVTPREVSACFKEKLHSHNQTLERYVEFLEDGELSAEEIAELERLLEKEDQARTLIRQGLQHAKIKLERKGPKRMA